MARALHHTYLEIESAAQEMVSYYYPLRDPLRFQASSCKLASLLKQLIVRMKQNKGELNDILRFWLVAVNAYNHEPFKEMPGSDTTRQIWGLYGTLYAVGSGEENDILFVCAANAGRAIIQACRHVCNPKNESLGLTIATSSTVRTPPRGRLRVV